MELHHIKRIASGGEDTLDNCITLCFDCHSDMGKADPKHPKGKRYTESELKEHRDRWYDKITNTPKCYQGDICCVADKDLFQLICEIFSSM